MGTSYVEPEGKENKVAQIAFNLNVWENLIASQSNVVQVVDQKSVNWIDTMRQAASHEMASIRQPLCPVGENIVHNSTSSSVMWGSAQSQFQQLHKGFFTWKMGWGMQAMFQQGERDVQF